MNNNPPSQDEYLKRDQSKTRGQVNDPGADIVPDDQVTQACYDYEKSKPDEGNR